MRVGVFGLTAPKHVESAKALEWAIGEAAKMKADVLGWNPWPSSHSGAIPYDPGYWRELRQLASDNGVRIEPYVRWPFDLTGPDAARGRAAMLESIQGSKILGDPVVRSGYGDQTLKRTRFSQTPLVEHLTFVEENLREAAKLAESEGVILALENHTDFSGRELASVFEVVGSNRIRCAFDTGNGMTIFSDPHDDAEALARWAVTTHMKDMRVIENPRPESGPSPLVPFGLIGCPIGEGHIDLRRIIRRLVADSPLGRDIPFITEPSWPHVRPGEDIYQKRHELLNANLANLRLLLQDMPEPASS